MKRIIGILLVFAILLLSIRPVGAEVIPIYVGLDFYDAGVTIPVNLPVNNYSIYVNAEGYSSYWEGYSTFTITRNDITYFTVSTDKSEAQIFLEIERRLVISEAGEYDFHFYGSFIEGDYVNYEVILTEIEIVIDPKTSIISEAPYGIVFIMLAIISYTLIRKKKI